MSSQSEALRLTLEAIRAMRETGYTQEDVQELIGEAFEHLEGWPPAIRLRPLYQLPTADHRLVSLPVEHPGPEALPQVRQALVRTAPVRPTRRDRL